MKDAKRRFRPCARNRTGGTLFQGGFQRVFLLRKPPFFRFSQKNIVKFLCLRKEVLRIAYIYKKEDCDCRYCLYYSKGKCKLQWCCCYQDKVRTGSPFTSNMKIIIKRRKEQHDQLKNQNEWYCAKPHTALSRSIHSRHYRKEFSCNCI